MLIMLLSVVIEIEMTPKNNKSVERGKADNVNGNIAKNILTTVKVKVKFTLEQATKAQRGSRCIAVLFLQPRHRMGVGGQRHAPTALSPGKTRYPLYGKLGGP
jgi:hypothetical protein